MSKKFDASKAETVETQEQGDLLDKILNEGGMVRDAGQVGRAKDTLKDLLKGLKNKDIAVSKNLEAAIKARIAAIDEIVSEQLNEIMHHPDFQRLEASWRGLHYLVDKSETGQMLKIRVLNTSKRDLLRDFERSPEFDQSALFQKVYEEEFGTFGGDPFGALIGDYEFSNHPEDIQLLTRISEVAASANAPFISAAAPELFGWNSFTRMSKQRDMAKIFDGVEYAPYKSFRASDNSRYVGLCLPHVLMRLPYGRDTATTDTFNFEEDVDGREHTKYLWGNAAYAFATRLTESFAKYQWCAAIRGVEGGGLVLDLPSHTFDTDEGDVAQKCPTEISIPERRDKELSDLGFIPLVHCKNTDYAAFFAAQSCHKPPRYDSDYANANARISTQLPYMFAVSRFAHYLKAMMRDKIGSFMSRADCEQFLNQWIMNYVTEDDTATPETKAQFPLRDARIEVKDVPGKTGVYHAVAFLRPHYQLDELTISLRLVAELPPAVRGEGG
ncbi:MAG TPA: type VI secretion system contractile sheath large subunit [Pyrinomonadaceae bacterium]|jgi:type VI secretion system protein ImpC